MSETELPTGFVRDGKSPQGAAGTVSADLNQFDQPAQNAAVSCLGARSNQADALYAGPLPADVPASSTATAEPGAAEPGGAPHENVTRPAPISQSTAAPAPGDRTTDPAVNSTNAAAAPAATRSTSPLPPDQNRVVSGTALIKTPAAVHLSSASATENIAGSLQGPAQAQAARLPEPDRRPKSDIGLDPDRQHVTPLARSVGITSAERLVDMRKSAETSAPVGLAPTWGSIVPAVASSIPASTGDSVLHTASLSPTTHAAAAIEATLDAVERGRDAASSSVELKLTFGDDTRLAVRIELSDGTVQTTFRTDSADLRQALASEWHQTVPAILAASSDRELRVAEPVFTPAAGSRDFAGNPSGGHANTHQEPSPAPADRSFLPTASIGSRATPPATSVPAGPPGLPTSLRLNVFA